MMIHSLLITSGLGFSQEQRSILAHKHTSNLSETIHNIHRQNNIVSQSHIDFVCWLEGKLKEHLH